MRRWIVVFSLLFLAGCSGTGGATVASSPPSVTTDQTTAVSESMMFETQSNSEASVDVRVTPLDLGSTDWTFEVGLSTHSVELAEDLMEVSVLRTDDGREFRPLTWDGPAPGGHHISGVLSFPNPRMDVKELTVEVREVGGVPVRTFHWSRENK